MILICSKRAYFVGSDLSRCLRASKMSPTQHVCRATRADYQMRMVASRNVVVNRFRLGRQVLTMSKSTNRTMSNTKLPGGSAIKEDTKKGASSSISSFFKQALAWYSHILDTHPIATKCLTSGFIAGSGDFLCQYLVFRNTKGVSGISKPEKDAKFEPNMLRTGRFTFLGFAFVAPAVHLWYGRLVMHFPGNSPAQVLKRLVLDQCFFAPLFVPAFMVNLMALEGRPLAEMPGKLKSDYFDTMITNWCLWVPAQLVNFRFIPLKFQVLFGNGIGFIWNTYFSWKTQDANVEILAIEETVTESRM
uniref:Peroxisomal membrane protein MPV17 n=1 Tax=Odontella aurita TaxID=265563 RepID=A0A7S4M7U8_9STRA|mmetsp:Transcript_13876/g.40584  ORF Transcript_13876/g.40584 Transcript_13876/m.40584 type:complete len:304 (+) Transcript_13876:374-1285(+)